MRWIKTHRKCIEVIFILLLCSFPLFYRLDALPIRQWDEARNAVSAIEMLQNRNFIVRYFNGEPDYWDVKPPLLIWLQVIASKVFGINEMAIRIPSALAALLTAAFIIWYFDKFHQKIYIGYLSAAILVTSFGYVDRHVARTGDHDALLVLFTTMIVYLYFEFAYSRPLNNRILISMAVFFCLAILTKSIAVFMIFPGLVVLTFLFNFQNRLFTSKWFYICMLSVILLTTCYYYRRNLLQPGYLKAVWEGELFPRYFNTNEAFDNGTFFYYGRLLFSNRYPYWIFFLIPSIILLPFISDRKQKLFAVCLFINALLYFLVISAGTKNMWYDAPLYPMFSSIIAVSIQHFLQKIRILRSKSMISGKILAILVVVMLLSYPSYITIQKVKRTSEFYWDEEIYSISYLLRDCINGNLLLESPAAILFEGYNAHLLFYTKALGMKNGTTIPFKTINEIQHGDTVLLSHKTILDTVNKMFTYQVLHIKDRGMILKITGSSDP